jgi:hypothetical protein
MLAEEDYASPIDYRDLLYVYKRRAAAIAQVDGWLHSLLDAVVATLSGRGLPG